MVNVMDTMRPSVYWNLLISLIFVAYVGYEVWRVYRTDRRKNIFEIKSSKDIAIRTSKYTKHN